MRRLQLLVAVLFMGVPIARTSTAPAVPTIDLAKFLAGTPAEQSEIVEEVRACCHEGGSFFYLVNHGIPQPFIDEVEQVVQGAFALPESEKAKIDKRLSKNFRGWERAGLERTGGRPDSREQIDTWSDADAARDAGESDFADRLLGKSQYFSEDVLPDYERLTKAWMKACSGVCEKLLEVFSLGMELPADALSRRFGEIHRRQSLIKYIHYPPTPDGGQGVGLHQDSLFLTLLLPGHEGGLEVQLPDGSFARVDRRVDAQGHSAFVVNLGEVMAAMTGGYFLATPHRVHAARDRYVVAFFYGPVLEARLNPPLPLPPRLAGAVARSERHRSAGASPTPEELARGVTGSFDGASKHRTYGDLLWNYFGRSHPEYVALHWGADGRSDGS
jgi:isopenicillin N synthase-like dioxygenase